MANSKKIKYEGILETPSIGEILAKAHSWTLIKGLENSKNKSKEKIHKSCETFEDLLKSREENYSYIKEVEPECFSKICKFIAWAYKEKYKALYKHYGFDVANDTDLKKYAFDILERVAAEHIEGFNPNYDIKNKKTGRPEKWGIDFVTEVMYRAKHSNKTIRNMAQIVAKEKKKCISLNTANSRFYEAKEKLYHPNQEIKKDAEEFEKMLNDMDIKSK